MSPSYRTLACRPAGLESEGHLEARSRDRATSAGLPVLEAVLRKAGFWNQRSGCLMDEVTWIYATASLMAGTFAVQVLTKKFDPFSPIWLFFVGYFQIYVIQALSYHDWAIRARGVELVTEANFRAFWALALFVGLYFFGPGKALCRLLPRPPTGWSTAAVLRWCPVLVVWGGLCAAFVMRMMNGGETASPEEALILSFPMVMLVGGSLLIVTGRQPSKPRPAITAAGVAVVACYLMIWVFNGKRSHSLVSVLVGVSSFYIPRLKRPSFAVLLATALAGSMAVGLSISWRYYSNSHTGNRSFSQFGDFIATFDPESVLESVNVKEKEAKPGMAVSYETEEYGGFLLMLDTVPMKSDYDYGVNYLRVFSTFIPRIFWADKPIYGRQQWIEAWIAGVGGEAKRGFHRPRHRHPGSDPAQWRRRRNVHRVQRHRPSCSARPTAISSATPTSSGSRPAGRSGTTTPGS